MALPKLPPPVLPSGSPLLSPSSRVIMKLGDEHDDPRPPRTRGDCAAGIRPCPWVRCRHHLIHERLPSTRLFESSPEEVARIVVDELDQSCALDVAALGPHTLEVTSRYIGNVTRERTRQIETSAMRKAKRRLRLLVDDTEVRDASMPSRAGFRSLKHSEIDMEIERLKGFVVREGAVSPETVARSFGWSQHKAYWRIQRLVRQGDARRRAAGLYESTPPSP